MAHEIEFRNGKECFVFAGQPAWHGLGTEVPSDITPIEMLQVAGLDWKVELEPSFIERNGKKIPDGDVALVRDIDDKILSKVSGNWKPCQNIEAFEFFNSFVEAGDMTMETAGSLREGKHVWAMARVKDSFELFNGDTVEAFLLFSNPHQYGQSIDIRFVAERVVCANTIAIALSEKCKSFARISHRREFNPDVAKEMLGISHGYMEEYKERAEFLGSKMYNPDSVKEFMMKVFPVVQAANANGPARKEISKTARDILENVLDDQPGNKFARGSWWQAFNAVTFHTNHLAGRSADNRVNSLWFKDGADTNMKALRLAVDYARAA